MEERCVFGLTEKQASGLSYVIGWISGLVIFVAEPANKTVKFNALQSIVLFGAISVAQVVLGALAGIPLLGWIFSICISILGIATFAAWLYLLVSAFQGKTVKLPIIGDAVWAQVYK